MCVSYELRESCTGRPEIAALNRDGRWRPRGTGVLEGVRLVTLGGRASSPRICGVTCDLSKELCEM